MMTFIADRLAEYGIKSLRVNNCTVRVAEPMNTVLGFWPVVVIESDQVSDNHNCPRMKGGKMMPKKKMPLPVNLNDCILLMQMGYSVIINDGRVVEIRKEKKR